MNSLENFDTERFFLGSVCKRGHCNGGDNVNLRYKNNSGCVQCLREKFKDPEQAERRRQYMATESRRAVRRKESADWYRSEAGQEWQKAYQNSETGKAVRDRANRKYHASEHGQKWLAEYRKSERRKAISAAYSRSEKGKVAQRVKKHRRRAIKRRVHAHPWTIEQWKQRCSQFRDRCAYCDTSSTKLTMDHFIAIVKGGPDCIGNILPACQPCNASKHCSDPESWYEARSFYSKRRWAKILQVLGLQGQNVGQLPLI